MLISSKLPHALSLAYLSISGSFELATLFRVELLTVAQWTDLAMNDILRMENYNNFYPKIEI